MPEEEVKAKNNLKISPDFEAHWRDNKLAVVSLQKLKEADEFLKPVKKNLRKQIRILDVGCGDGVHYRLLSNLAQIKANYLGLDISLRALRNLKRKKGKLEPFLVQADVLDMPLVDSSFAIVFAFGVLAYTTDPFKAFRQMCRVCARGGWLGVWLYPKQKGLGGLAFSGVRRLCQVLGPWGTQIIANLIVPFLGFLPTRSRMSLRNSSWQECREVVSVNIAPKQLEFFEEKEIKNWFRKCGIKIKWVDKNNPITIWGVKK